MDREINVLFVDDQWCTSSGRDVLIASFGDLLRRDPPCIFHYETGESSNGQYSPEPVLKQLECTPKIDAIVLDVMFGSSANRLGLDILSAIRDRYPTLPVFMLTSLEGDNIDVVERAMELGANEYLVKKPTVEEFEKVLRIYTQLSSAEADYALWGNSSAIRKIRAVIARLSTSGMASVLVTGESGTGKELVARAVHRQGVRRRGPFIDKNCAHERSDLLDSDLFGHEKGSFTGAHQRHIGRIERADKGVLFLDEIGSMPLELQTKLLRVLETKRFQRVGGKEDVTSDFQLICATNDNPAKMVEEGRLREDLYYRIYQFPIHVPPLRERREDIRVLADLFLRRFRAGPGASYPAGTFSPDALGLLTSYPWPGNVRELKNVIERATILARTSPIRVEDLSPEVRMTSVTSSSESYGNSIVDSREWSDNPRDWGLAYARLQLEYVARVCEIGLDKKMRATEIVSSLWPRDQGGKVGKGSTEKLKAFLRQMSKPPWGHPQVTHDEICKSLMARIQRCISLMGRKSSES